MPVLWGHLCDAGCSRGGVFLEGMSWRWPAADFVLLCLTHIHCLLHCQISTTWLYQMFSPHWWKSVCLLEWPIEVIWDLAFILGWLQRANNFWERLLWYVGEGNGNPLQYSCLENPMDGGAWWAAVHGVPKSWTQLSDFTFTFKGWAGILIGREKSLCNIDVGYVSTYQNSLSESFEVKRCWEVVLGEKILARFWQFGQIGWSPSCGI